MRQASLALLFFLREAVIGLHRLPCQEYFNVTSSGAGRLFLSGVCASGPSILIGLWSRGKGDVQNKSLRPDCLPIRSFNRCYTR